MANANPRYAIRTLTIPADVWTPITAAIPCDYLSVCSYGAARVRSDKDDPTTEKHLDSGGQEVILAPIGMMLTAPPRFKAGDVVFFMRAVTGTSALEITFIY